MHEILATLRPGSVVLDLGSGAGSFDSSATSCTAVRFDLKIPPVRPPHFVQGTATHLPFRSACFDAVLSNHSLEHIAHYKGVLQELGRVVKPSGAVYLAVPDASTPQDRLYRWLTEGKDHVNLFADPVLLAGQVSWYTALPCVGMRRLYSSYSFLNRRNVRHPAPRRFRLVAIRAEWLLALWNKAIRAVDRHFGTRLGLYGWAFYFGAIGETVSADSWNNVCLRCGQAHEDTFLVAHGAVQRVWYLGQGFRCPSCGAVNAFFPDKDQHKRA